jgi:hypothetical protein
MVACVLWDGVASKVDERASPWEAEGGVRTAWAPQRSKGQRSWWSEQSSAPVRCPCPEVMSTCLCTATRDRCPGYVAPTSHVLTCSWVPGPGLGTTIWTFDKRSSTERPGLLAHTGTPPGLNSPLVLSCTVVDEERAPSLCRRGVPGKALPCTPRGQPPATHPAVSSRTARGALRQGTLGPLTSLSTNRLRVFRSEDRSSYAGVYQG